MGCGASSRTDAQSAVKAEDDQLANCQDLDIEWGNYRVEKVVGSGSAGTVVQARCLSSGVQFAVKKVKPNQSALKQSRGVGFDVTENEIECLRHLQHPGIIGLVESFKFNNSLVIVTELMAGGDLWGRISAMRRVPEEQARIVMRQLLSAVDFMHKHNICHRDLKPENVLMACDDQSSPGYWMVKICDFGLSCRDAEGYRDVMHSVCGTPEFSAPEVLEACIHQRTRYSCKIDVWSLGCILHCMLCGKLPFGEGDLATLYRKVTRGKIDYNEQWKELSDEAKFLVEGMLKLDSDQRPTAQQCRNMGFIRERAWSPGTGPTGYRGRSRRCLLDQAEKARSQSPVTQPFSRGVSPAQTARSHSTRTSPRTSTKNSPVLKAQSPTTSCKDIILHPAALHDTKLSKLQSSYEVGWDKLSPTVKEEKLKDFPTSDAIFRIAAPM